PAHLVELARLQVLADLPAHPLELASAGFDFALPRVALAIAHRGGIAVGPAREIAQVAIELHDRCFALLELLLDLARGILRGFRFAENAIGVDDADLVVLGVARRAAHAKAERQEQR